MTTLPDMPNIFKLCLMRRLCLFIQWLCPRTNSLAINSVPWKYKIW